VISYERNLPELHKLEWEFSRFINQMVTITLTYNEISPAEDSRADLDESI
jgi:hypothetical protein